MPRGPREKSSTGIYHVMLRGINKQTIFEDDEDHEKFLQILRDCKTISEFELYAYCLMGNHVHLLLKEGKESVAQIFKRIGARYVFWYNWKYMRCGHLFQDRYKSEAVEDDPYFAVVLRYIHQNPKKAGLCATLDEYKWSSYNDYIRKSEIIDYRFTYGIVDENKFKKFMSEDNDDDCLEHADQRKRLSDDELLMEIKERFKINADSIQSKPRDSMECILNDIMKIDGVSTRQLSRVTGISTNIIWNLKSE